MYGSRAAVQMYLMRSMSINSLLTEEMERHFHDRRLSAVTWPVLLGVGEGRGFPFKPTHENWTATRGPKILSDVHWTADRSIRGGNTLTIYRM